MVQESRGVAASADRRSRIKAKSVGVGSILLAWLFVVLSRDTSAGFPGTFSVAAAIVFAVLGVGSYAGKRWAVIVLRGLYYLMLLLTATLAVAYHFLSDLTEGRARHPVVFFAVLLSWMGYSIFALQTETE